MLTWLGRVLVTSGAAALLWCGYVVAEGYVVQQSAHRRLHSMRDAGTTAPIRAELPAAPDAEMALPPTAEERSSRPMIFRPMEPPAAALGELAIPRLEFSAVVFEGTTAGTLRVGLGHLEETPLPGRPGNVTVVGHRDSFFRPLRNLQEGDDIWFDTVDQRVRYRVSWLRVVDPHELSVLEPTPEPALTLVTCFPFEFLGPAPYRFVVRAIRIEALSRTE